MSNTLQVKANDGRMVTLTAAQAQAVQVLNQARNGGCASVIGYKPTTNWVEQPTQNIQLIANFSTERLYKRRLEALSKITYADVAPKLLDDEKLAELSSTDAKELFETRKATIVASLEKSLAAFAGEEIEVDAHREAHKRCYATIGEAKVNLFTEKVDGIKQPEQNTDGSVIAQTVMVPYLELNTTTVVEGKRKVVNSGAPVRMGNLIERCLNKRSVVYKTLSLKADNFEQFRIDKKEINPGEVSDFRDLLLG